MTVADVRLVVALVVLLAVAIATLTIAGVPRRREAVIAACRAAVQLALVAAALRGVFASPPAVALALAVMATVVVRTAAKRLGGGRDATRAVALACLTAAGVTVGVVVGLPALQRDVRTLVAVSGIVLGGTMTAATLTGRHLRAALTSRRDEVEGMLALGATMREAVRPLARDAAGEALVPGLDQTRTVGLVTLPGAFVGALLGGAGAADAARFQLTVLVALVCAQSITATMLARLLGAPAALPGPPI